MYLLRRFDAKTLRQENIFVAEFQIFCLDATNAVLLCIVPSNEPYGRPTLAAIQLVFSPYTAVPTARRIKSPLSNVRCSDEVQESLASAHLSALCCNSMVPASNKAAAAIAGLVGLNLAGVTGNVALIFVADPNQNPCLILNEVVCDSPDPAWSSLIAINCRQGSF
ncbi:hypothetical protein B0H19DRAFT_1071197 [Mycena capillaripes]|nr:hypothetical protein B0H19DRAFT_1071197 [Mycena capillaripes]